MGNEGYKVVDTRIMSNFLHEINEIEDKYGIYISCDLGYDDFTYPYLKYVDKDNLPIFEGHIADTVVKETPEPTSKRLKRETEKLIEELEHWKNLL